MTVLALTTSLNSSINTASADAIASSAWSCLISLDAYTAAFSATMIPLPLGTSLYTESEDLQSVTLSSVPLGIPTTILCDGIPRLYGSATGTGVTTEVITWGISYIGTNPASTSYPTPTNPPCSIEDNVFPSYCDQIISVATETDVPPPSALYSSCTISQELEADSHFCTLAVNYAQLIYWPVTTRNGDFCKQNGVTITATPTGNGPNTVVRHGTTFTSPFVYFHISGLDYYSYNAENSTNIQTNTLISVMPDQVPSYWSTQDSTQVYLNPAQNSQDPKAAPGKTSPNSHANGGQSSSVQSTTAVPLTQSQSSEDPISSQAVGGIVASLLGPAGAPTTSGVDSGMATRVGGIVLSVPQIPKAASNPSNNYPNANSAVDTITPDGTTLDGQNMLVTFKKKSAVLSQSTIVIDLSIAKSIPLVNGAPATIIGPIPTLDSSTLTTRQVTEPSSLVLLDSTTLSVGGDALTIAGTRLTLGSSGIVLLDAFASYATTIPESQISDTSGLPQLDADVLTLTIGGGVIIVTVLGAARRAETSRTETAAIGSSDKESTGPNGAQTLGSGATSTTLESVTGLNTSLSTGTVSTTSAASLPTHLGTSSQNGADGVVTGSVSATSNHHSGVGRRSPCGHLLRVTSTLYVLVLIAYISIVVL